MLRTVSSKLTKAAQYSFLEEIPDDAEDPARGINEENYNKYLVDDIEKGPQEHEEYPQPQPGDFLSEMPMGNEMVGVPPESLQKRYDNNPFGLVNDGINNNELISFHYTTRDYGDRVGHYAGLRTVEPHYTFVAHTTGNEVLLNNRIWFECHFPGRPLNIATVEETKEIMDLFAKYQNRYYISSNSLTNT